MVLCFDSAPLSEAQQGATGAATGNEAVQLVKAAHAFADAGDDAAARKGARAPSPRGARSNQKAGGPTPAKKK